MISFQYCKRVSVSASDAIDEYFALVYAGLTGSVTMITCTVLALTRLVFEYKGKPVDFAQFPVVPNT